MSRNHRPPVSTSKLALALRKKSWSDSIAVVVGDILNDERRVWLPKMRVCALRFSAAARKAIEGAGGECITFDQLPLLAPKGYVEHTFRRVACFLSSADDVFVCLNCYPADRRSGCCVVRRQDVLPARATRLLVFLETMVGQKWVTVKMPICAAASTRGPVVAERAGHGRSRLKCITVSVTMETVCSILCLVHALCVHLCNIFFSWKIVSPPFISLQYLLHFCGI